MPGVVVFAGWVVLLLSIFGGVWILIICLQHRKQRELNNENGPVENGHAGGKKKKQQRGQNDNGDVTLPNGRPRSHDQRELPNVPRSTVGDVAAAAATITVTPSHSALFDEEDGGHYDVIPRLPLGALPRDDTELDSSSYAPVGSETYSAAPDPSPEAALLLDNDELDPRYADIGSGGSIRRSLIARHPRHNYETVDATYAQVFDRDQQQHTGAGAPGGRAVVLAPTPMFEANATGGLASGKEARYFKVTAREPLADLRRRQAEEEAEAERLREAAYATVGEYDSEVQGTPPPPVPPAGHLLRPGSQRTHNSDAYAEVGGMKSEVVAGSMTASMSGVPEPPPVHTLKRLTSCNASPRHDASEAGYSSVRDYRPFKINSLPRSVQGIDLSSTASPSDIYSVVDKRPRDKVATIHVVPNGSTNGHVDDIYAVVNKPRRHNSARAGSDGAAVAVVTSDDEVRRLLLDKVSAKSAVATPPLNGYRRLKLKEEPGYSRCEDVIDRQLLSSRNFIDGSFAVASASDGGDPNYESIDAVVESANAKLRSDTEATAASGFKRTSSLHPEQSGGSALVNRLQRPKTWVPLSGSAVASSRMNGLVHHAVTSAAGSALASTAASNSIATATAAWQKRQPTEPIYQDIDELQQSIHEDLVLGDTFARL